jgi:hypothetical protein
MRPRSDSDIDRELQALLDVDPAAGFTARVRKAIESDASKPSLLHGSFFRAAVAAGALLVIGTAAYLRQPVADKSPAASHLGAAAQVEPASPSEASLPPAENVRADSTPVAPVPGLPVEPVRPRRLLDDEVIVPAEQLAVYERFFRRAASDPLVASFEDQEDRSAALSIPPLEIEPIETFPEMEGVRQ